ncbi:MAG: type IX secretion system outer membrane channel protein PorV [Cyclobacteriaceae bacterium]|jgi:hypothetical protein|nr:type IX secretion system outer membrane channel protein PorV [Cyclobacteriaceae bacterium]
MNKLYVGAWISVLALFGVAKAQPIQGTLIGQDSTRYRPIITAVPFLLITPDSRAAGMGDAGVATTPDANSNYWNAAKLAFIDKGYGVSGSYTPWLGKIVNDMSIFYVSGFYKITNEQTVAASMKYFDLGGVQLRDGSNNSLGDFNPRDFAFDVTYSRKLTDEFSIGGSLRYIHSNLVGFFSSNGVEAQPGNSVAVDLGVFHTKPLESRNATLSWGASITNIGAKITYSNADNRDFIPTNLRVGGAYKMELNPLNTITFALDLNKLMVPSPQPNGSERDKSLLNGMFGSFTDARGGFREEIQEVAIASGVEYWYDNKFSGRLGYFHEATDKGNRKYLTAGVGARVDNFGFDMAYLVPTNRQENALAETIRFSIHFVFENKLREADTVTE